MTDFDPLRLAAACREGSIHLPTERPAADLDAAGRGRVAAFALETIVSAWIVGEGPRFRAALARAADWLAAADAELGEDDREGLFGVVRRRRALATARWLLGEDGRAAAAGAARAGAARLAEGPRLGPHEFAEHLCDCLLAGEREAALAAAAALPPDPDDIEATTALRLARREEDEGELLTAAGLMLRLQLERWLYMGAYVRTAGWMRLILSEPPIGVHPEAALLAIYAFLPGVAVPPALAERGWRAGTRAARVALAAADFPRVERLMAFLGLRRDPDAVTQPPLAPGLASWSAPLPDDREIDWHDRDGLRWLEVRGCDAGILAGVLAAALGGRIAADPAEALARVLTLPSGGRSRASGALRWATLRAALATATPDTATAVAALVAAGLRDPDWRVRMTAVIGAGRLRLAGLAAEVRAVRVPRPGEAGLTTEEHRVLLALRQAAHDLALGLPPSAGPGEGLPEDVAALRRAFQGRLHDLIDGRAPRDRPDTAALLVAALTGGAEGTPCPLPRRWRQWLKA